MGSVAGRGRKGKNRQVLGKPALASAEQWAGIVLDAKAELIRALIPEQEEERLTTETRSARRKRVGEWEGGRVGG